VTFLGGFWSRMIVLFLSFVIGGILLNAQYSTEQMATVLSLHVPAPHLTGAFLLAVAVPLLVVFFGNIYCGYICPFGAAQELLSYIVPARFKKPISTEQMQKARFVKYVFLFVLIVVFFVSRNRTTLESDPLISIFSFQFLLPSFGSVLTVVVVAALIGSLFYTRFWCRYLCPAGAFLSLFNSAILLKKYLPAKRFGKCEFGLTVKDQLDCIYCDRCRYQSPVALRKEPLAQIGILSRSLLIIAVIVAIFAASISVSRFLQVMPVRSEYVTSFAPSGGVPRDVDLQKIRMLIEQNRLSDREADFYKKVE
jgi:polyferredoxin